MGMQQQVEFGPGQAPAWDAVANLLRRHGFPVQMRMIDNELAFPDEAPPESWRELRLGTPGGMVTVRREGHGVLVVIWGNADEPMQRAGNALAWAFAAASAGKVILEGGPVTADEYRRRHPLPLEPEG